MSVFAGAAKAEWHDMSNYVVHFTKEYVGNSLYDNIMQILGAGIMETFRNPFGIGRTERRIKGLVKFSLESETAAKSRRIPAHGVIADARRECRKT